MHFSSPGPAPLYLSWHLAGSSVVGHLAPGGPVVSPAGPMVDLGSRLHPLQTFLTYSGLWGALGLAPWSSGYWGPAFNETDMRADSFLKVWCFNIKDFQLAENGRRECYPDDMQ